MTDVIALKHAAEIDRATRWHTDAVETMTERCFLCRSTTIFRKSRWTVGRYGCEVCGYAIQVRWL